MGPKKRPRQITQSEEDSSDETEVTCKDCKKPFPLRSILRHLSNARSKRKCKKEYTEQEYESLMERCQQRTKAKQRKYAEEHYQVNRKEILESKGRHYQANKREILESRGRYYQANEEEIRESRKIHYQVNREKILEKRRKENKIAKDKLKSADRIRNFNQDIIDGPNFVCCSCKRELFKSGVKFFDLDDINQLKTKNNLDHKFLKAIGLDDLKDLILCHTCLKSIKKKKFPSMNEFNGLQLEDVPEELKLENLEQQLIAKTLLFIMVKRLPRTRMQAMTNEVINVPLLNEDIENNISILPRHPDDAHLVSVQLKRKLEYKNTHQAGYIRSDVVIEALKTLKERGNKYYQDININETFLQKEETEEEKEREAERMDFETESQKKEREEDEAWEEARKKEEEQRKADGRNEDSDSDDDSENVLNSVKNQQSKQSKQSFLMPEDLANEVQMNNSGISKKFGVGKRSIKIAPGEGKIPDFYMRENDFDVKAFPKHHPNGQFGLHHKRDHKLTAQMYFNQRLMNQDDRFSRDPCYLFMACYFLEKQSIERQIDISGVKGSSPNADGVKKLKLNNAFDVFAKVKGTPKYWQVSRNDLVAKVKQLGPFHVFFTFSCGEMRFTEIFLSIFRKKGLSVEIPENWSGDDKDIKVEGTDLWTYVNDVMSQNKHELFNNYVSLITRHFDARVKSFVKNILMGGGKDKVPIKYWSYRVEFQARGMPHIHGKLIN